jgi:GT2 family glycosyltransferase
MSRLSCAVVIPSVGRPKELGSCLRGLISQTLLPTEVVVVVRPDDRATVELIREHRRLAVRIRAVHVFELGLVAALNRGLRAVTSEIVAFTDDDAIPRPDWLERLVDSYGTDPSIAAVGGRDVIYLDGVKLIKATDGLRARLRGRRPPLVGRLHWYGRVSGNHHAGCGTARDVDVIKGANMSYRRSEIAEYGFDPRLAGSGSQVHNEPTVCFPLRRRGLRIIYDPAIIVDHYVSARPRGDERSSSDARSVREAAHNHTLAVLDNCGPARRATFVAWGALVGTHSEPGGLSAVRLAANGVPSAWTHLLAAQRGRWEGFKTHRHRERPRLQ